MKEKFYYDFDYISGNRKSLFSSSKYVIEPMSFTICNGEKSYKAIFNDFDFDLAWKVAQTDEVSKFLMKRIYLYLLEKETGKPFLSTDVYDNVDLISGNFEYKQFKRLLKKLGKSKNQVKEELISFVTPEWYWSDGLGELPFSRLEDNPIELFSLTADFNTVCLSILFNDSFPKGIPSTTKSIFQKMEDKFKQYNKSEIELIKNRKVAINGNLYPLRKNGGSFDRCKYLIEIDNFLNGIL